MHHTPVGKSRHKLPFQVGTGKDNRPISFCVAFAAQTKWWHVEIGYMAQRVAIYSTPQASPLVFFGPQMWENLPPVPTQCQPFFFPPTVRCSEFHAQQIGRWPGTPRESELSNAAAPVAIKWGEPPFLGPNPFRSGHDRSGQSKIRRVVS